jgi:hypothetical protein
VTTDSEIKRDVEAELRWVGGEVTLRGTVQSWAERGEERAAWMAPGVVWVENKIIVADSPRPVSSPIARGDRHGDHL